MKQVLFFLLFAIANPLNLWGQSEKNNFVCIYSKSIKTPVILTFHSKFRTPNIQKIKPNGKYNLNIKEPTIAFINSGYLKDIPLLLFPKDTIFIDDHDNKIEVIGKRQEEINFLQNYEQKFLMGLINLNKPQNIQFKQILQINETKLQSLKSQQNLSLDFINFMEKEYIYQIIKWCSEIYINSQEKDSIKQYLVSKKNLLESDNLQSGSKYYIPAIYGYLKVFSESKDEEFSYAQYKSMYEFSKYNFTGYVAENILFDLLKSQILITKDYAISPKKYQEDIGYFLNTTKDVELKNFINNNILLNNNIPADIIDEKLQDINGQFQSLDSILLNLKGKVIYIDFWASWCKPCIEEFKEAQKLYEIFKNREIVFLNLSIDENIDNWLNAIEKNSLIKPNIINYSISQNSKLVNFFLPDGSIPKYALVRKKGGLLNTNCLSPSDKNIIKFLVGNIDE